MRRAHQGKHSHENRAIGQRLKLHGRFFLTLMLCGLLASSTVLPAQALEPDEELVNTVQEVQPLEEGAAEEALPAEDDVASESDEPVAAEQNDEAVAPAETPLGGPVPLASSTTASIVVWVGGDRQNMNSTPDPVGASGVEGVVLRLSSSPTNANSWSSYPWATCTSDATGKCEFEVEISSSSTNASRMNRDAKPYVHQISAPSGWHLVQPDLGLSSGNNDIIRSPYVFRLDRRVANNNTYDSLSDTSFMRNGLKTSDEGSRKASNGRWMVVRDNPDLTQVCGLDVAVVADLSTSVGPGTSDSTGVRGLKRTIDAMVDGLRGTPSRMALFSFSRTSPAPGASQNYPTLMDVQTKQQADYVKSLYSGWTVDGATNWDHALWTANEAQTSTNNYDLVVMITDGLPTWHTNQTATGDWFNGLFSLGNLRSLEAGVYSANLLKSSGSRVVPIFVNATSSGTSVNSNQYTAMRNNLRAISGPTENTDFFWANNYDEAADQIAALAKGNCEGTVQVTKKVVDADYDIPANVTATQLDANSTEAEHWKFTARSTNTSLLTIPGANGSGDFVVKTDEDGVATIPLKFPYPNTEGPIQVTETQQSGYDLIQAGGKNAVCSYVDDNGNKQSVTVTNEGDLGFSLTAKTATATECVVYNQAKPESDFGFCTPDEGVVYAVTTTGQVAEYHAGTLQAGWSTLSNLGPVNALGIAPGGSTAYAIERTANAGNFKSILKYENGTFSRIAGSGITSFGPIDTSGLPSRADVVETNPAGVVAGAVNPNNGHYYFGGFERVRYEVRGDYFMRYTLVYFEYNPSTGVTTGPKRAKLWDLSLLNDTDHPNANGDFAFDTNGNLFLLVGTDQQDASGNPKSYYNNANVYRISQQSLQSTSPTASRVSMSGITGSGHNPRMGYANGIAFNGDGNLVISIGAGGGSQYAREYRSAMGSWSLVSTSSTSIAATDLSSCLPPSTLTIQKNITERAEDSDQFELSLAGSQGGTPFEKATTDGSDTGVQTEKIGPTIVAPGEEYFFSEAGAPDTGTDLDEYTSSYVCVNSSSGAELSSGDGTSGQVTIPNQAGASVTCTFTNTPVVEGEVVWSKTDNDGNRLEGSVWTLTGPSGSSSTSEIVEDCVADPEAGCANQTDKDHRAGYFKVTGLSTGVYSLTEKQAPAGYLLSDDVHSFEIGSGSGQSLEVDLGSIVNHLQPALVIPLTGGLGTDLFLIIGGVLVALLVAGVLYRRYSLKRALPGSVAASA